MKKLTFLIILIFITGTSVFAQTGTSLVMGGATAYSRGAEANFWNPANLALYDYKEPKFSMMLWSLSGNGWNNSFTRQLYDDHLGTGQQEHIDEAEKEDILGKISGQGLRFHGNTDFSILSFAYKNFGFSIQGGGYGESKIPKDIVELILKGNTDKQQYSFDVDGEGVAYCKTKFSYGHVVARDRLLTLPGNREARLSKVSIGAGLSYIYGGTVFEVLENQGMLNMENGFDASGSFKSRESMGGSGFGLDIGASVVTESNWRAGVYFDNLLSTISWSTDNKERSFIADLNGPLAIVDNFNENTGIMGLKEEDVKQDTTLDIGNFSTSLPIDFRFGFAKEGKKYLANMEIGTKNSDFLFSLGAQLKLNWFKIHVGYMHLSESQFSMGFAFDFRHFYMDFAMKQIGSLSPGGTKGLGGGTALGFAF